MYGICENFFIVAYCGASDVSVSNYIRVVMAVCLQKLTELLKKDCAESNAFARLTPEQIIS